MSNMDVSNQDWTVGRLLAWTAGWFSEHEVEGGRLAAELLLARALGCAKIDLYTRYETKPSPEERAAFRELVARAAEHTPIAYLLGEREFYSLPFTVTPAVLIPRPETETLVQRMIELCRAEPQRVWQVLEVGTGSACVAVAVAKFADNVRLVASDVSREALAVASTNVERHDVGERVHLVEADGLGVVPEVIPRGGFDAIISNPPYISDEVWPTLGPNVRDHEPRSALLGSGGDGLAMYRRFAAEGGHVLADNGRLLTEIGAGQLEDVAGVFAAAGGWGHVATHRDPTDPHDRVAEFQRRS